MVDLEQSPPHYSNIDDYKRGMYFQVYKDSSSFICYGGTATKKIGDVQFQKFKITFLGLIGSGVQETAKI